MRGTLLKLTLAIGLACFAYATERYPVGCVLEGVDYVGGYSCSYWNCSDAGGPPACATCANLNLEMFDQCNCPTNPWNCE